MQRYDPSVLTQRAFTHSDAGPPSSHSLISAGRCILGKVVAGQRRRFNGTEQKVGALWVGLFRTSAGHRGHVQLVSMVTVAGVALLDADAPAVLAAAQYPTILRATRPTPCEGVITPWEREGEL
jgi:hypothetical protein